MKSWVQQLSRYTNYPCCKVINVTWILHDVGHKNSISTKLRKHTHVQCWHYKSWTGSKVPIMELQIQMLSHTVFSWTVIVQSWGSKVSHYGIANSDDLTYCLFLELLTSPLMAYNTCTICYLRDLMVQFLRSRNKLLSYSIRLVVQV